MRGTSHGGACLPVLELRPRSVCFGRGVCWDWRVQISLQRKVVRKGSFPIVQCQPVLFFLRMHGRECVSMWCGARDEEGRYSLRLVRGTSHGGACLPVLEREQCECLKSPSNSHWLLWLCLNIIFFARQEVVIIIYVYL